MSAKMLDSGLMPLNMFIASEDNPRKPQPTDLAIIDLAASLSNVGQIHPIAARPHPDIATAYQVRAGHCRLVAAGVAGFETIRAEIYDWNDDEAFLVTMEENRARQDLTPMQEAALCKTAVDRFDVETAAEKLGQSFNWVRRRASLNRLSKVWLDELGKPASPFADWTIGHLEIVAKLNEERQDTLLKVWLDNNWMDWAMTTIADIREKASQFFRSLAAVPWDLTDQTLADSPACTICIHKSSCSPFLPNLLEDPEADECQDAECYAGKMNASVLRQLAELDTRFDGDFKVVLYSNWKFKGMNDAIEAKYKTLDYYQIDKCKKADKGAERVVMVEEAKIGKAYWAKPRPGCGSTEPKKEGPTTLKEKRAKLKQRRLAKAVDKLKEDLLDAVPVVFEMFQSTFANSMANGIIDAGLMKLASVFGTDHTNRWAGVSIWSNLEKPESELQNDLFDSICTVISGRLEYALVMEVKDTESKKVCELLGLDWKAYVKSATEAIPEPKSGTPKAAKAKKTPAPKGEWKVEIKLNGSVAPVTKYFKGTEATARRAAMMVTRAKKVISVELVNPDPIAAKKAAVAKIQKEIDALKG